MLAEERIRTLSVGAAAEALLRRRGEVPALQRCFDRSSVPMVMLDDQRRHVDANRSARLALRLSMAELRSYPLDELVPREERPALKPVWDQLLESGRVAGQSVFAGPDGGRMEVVYSGFANALPGKHMFAFAPAGWPEDELARTGGDADRAVTPLTSREREILPLAAEGLSGPDIAELLVLSPWTVKTHFRNLYKKLGVADRAAAVAEGMRLGLID